MRGVRGFAVVLPILLAASIAGADTVLHVAPEGCDAWSGRLGAPNRAQTDGPLASLEGARDAIRRLRAVGAPAGAVTVRIRGGTYRLARPFVLEPQDSGTAEAHVVYEAAPGERPVFSGGRAITNFVANGPNWEARPEGTGAGGWTFRQLFVDGQRRPRARSPNAGYHRVAGVLPGPPVPNAKPLALDRFVFAPGDVRPWARLGDVCITLMHSWETSIHPVAAVDTASNLVTFVAPLKEWWGVGYWEEAQRYTVENALELLDAPGEWYLDRGTGVLTYRPMPGERPGRVAAVAPALGELVRFAGDAEAGRFVEHVMLRGLAFHHADWELAPRGNSSTQAAVEVPAAIVADGARHCAIEGGEVAHVGTYAIWLRRGCRGCRIVRNRLFDLGAGGVRVGEDRMAAADAAESRGNLVDNNHIFDGGRVYAGAVGVWVAQSSGNTIAHNDIHDLFYTGISVGWNWDTATNRTHHNTIEYNHVHDLVGGVLSDAGLIYCLGVSPGSVIRHNVLHDIWPYEAPALAWGIYLDAQCGQYRVESNLVYNTHSGGLMFNNGGHAHTIRHNVFAYSARQALWPYSEQRPSRFVGNIVYLTQGDLLCPQGEASLAARLAAGESPGDWDGNLYWHAGGADRLRFYRRPFAAWQAIGLDRHSRVADPRFRNPAARDFRLRADSPALAMGIPALDLARAGLYGDRAWVREARHAGCRVRDLPPPPPPPKPLELDDGFEATPPGRFPAAATVSGEEAGASIRVSAERASAGAHSLRIADRAALQPAWQPHVYYQPHHTGGTVRLTFDVWMATNAQFFVEWRDAGPYPRCIGPSVRFDGTGAVTVAGRTLAAIPAGAWVGVAIEAALGPAAPRTFTLTLRPPGGPEQVFRGLPVAGADFAEVHWLGFSSTAAADTDVYLDNLRFGRAQ